MNTINSVGNVVNGKETSDITYNEITLNVNVKATKFNLMINDTMMIGEKFSKPNPPEDLAWVFCSGNTYCMSRHNVTYAGSGGFKLCIDEDKGNVLLTEGKLDGQVIPKYVNFYHKDELVHSLKN